jgi:hypothetical protein
MTASWSLIGAQAIGDAPEVFFDGRNPGDTFWRPHSMTFVFPSVPPGLRTVRIQNRSLNGNEVFLSARTLMVQFRN